MSRPGLARPRAMSRGAGLNDEALWRPMLAIVNSRPWVKDQGGMGSLWRSQSEFVVALKKPGPHQNNVQLGKLDRDRSNVWHMPGAGTKGSDANKMLAHHPTPSLSRCSPTRSWT